MTYRVSVTEEDEGIRLDRWFKRHYPGLSHGLLQKWLRKGQVRLDGKKREASQRITAGQELSLPPSIEEYREVQAGVKSASKNAEPYRLSKDDRALLRAQILYDKDGLLAINKPAGLAVQGGSGIGRSLDRILAAWADEQGEPAPKLTHRLDKDTSGVVLLARTAKLAAALTEAFREHQVTKTYLAIVVGIPELERGEIDLPLAKQGGAQEKMAVTEKSDGGKWAVTRYEMLDRAGNRAALLALYPETGRTHQLRVHMAATGTPILGDGKYGGQDAFLEGLELPRQLHLHATSIALALQGLGELEIVAPPAPHMRKSMQALGLEFG